MKGVTEELATEIKTEIREVINTVDNVLSESMENLDVNSSYEKRYSPDFRRTSSIPLLNKSPSSHYPMPNHSHSDKTSYYCNLPMPNYGMENGRRTPSKYFRAICIM